MPGHTFSPHNHTSSIPSLYQSPCPSQRICNPLILEFRDLLAESDARLDPQAYVLKPQVVYDIASELVKAENSFQMTKMGAQLALDKITEAVNSGEVYVEEREKKWLDIIGNQIDDIADDELEFYDDMQDELDMDKFIPSEYGL